MSGQYERSEVQEWESERNFASLAVPYGFFSDGDMNKSSIKLGLCQMALKQSILIILASNSKQSCEILTAFQ